MTHVADVVIDNTKVDASLTDFVVYIDLSDLPTTEFWGTVANGGGDIRVFKSDGTTELARDVVSCDTATDTGELWVKYSGTLSSSSDTTIQIHADGASSDYAVTATYGRNAVWSEAEASLLMEGLVPADRAGNHTFTAGGATITESSGPYGGALSFPTMPGAWLTNSDPSLRDILATYDTTISVITRRTSTLAGDPSVVSWSGTDDFILYAHETKGALTAGARVFWRDVGGSMMVSADNAMPKDAWAWLSFTTRGPADHELYVDGASEDASASTGGAGPFSDFYVGTFDAGTQIFYGDVAQVVIWKSARPAAWISTEHNNQSSPGTFYAASAPSGGATTPQGTVTISAVDPAQTTAEIPYSYDDTDESGYEYRIDGGTASSIDASPATITGLTAGTTYDIEVRAVNAEGAGAWSTPFEFTTNAASGTITVTEPLKNNTGTLLASETGIKASVLDAITLASVYEATGLTTNASGALEAISNAAITASSSYHVAIKLADGSVGITGPITAT